MKPKDAIKEYYGESTCPTAPKLVRYGWIKKDEVAYELTEGSLKGGKEHIGYRNRELAGVNTVSVVIKQGGEWDVSYDDCETFWGEDTREKAEKHIDELKEKYQH